MKRGPRPAKRGAVHRCEPASGREPVRGCRPRDLLQVLQRRAPDERHVHPQQILRESREVQPGCLLQLVSHMPHGLRAGVRATRLGQLRVSRPDEDLPNRVIFIRRAFEQRRRLCREVEPAGR